MTKSTEAPATPAAPPEMETITVPGYTVTRRDPKSVNVTEEAVPAQTFDICSECRHWSKSGAADRCDCACHAKVAARKIAPDSAMSADEQAAHEAEWRKRIAAAKSPGGSWSRATLAQWGVPWPPPRGWKEALIAGRPIPVRHGLAATPAAVDDDDSPSWDES
jgi:hypothetical protein